MSTIRIIAASVIIALGAVNFALADNLDLSGHRTASETIAVAQ